MLKWKQSVYGSTLSCELPGGIRMSVSLVTIAHGSSIPNSERYKLVFNGETLPPRVGSYDEGKPILVEHAERVLSKAVLMLRLEQEAKP